MIILKVILQDGQHQNKGSYLLMVKVGILYYQYIGCGKKYTTIYISLYGISNLEDISKKIFIETTQVMDKGIKINRVEVKK